jgi:transposase
MKKGNMIFKAYTMEQPSLLPPNLEEIIPEDHLVRVVNRVVDAIDLDPPLQV